MYRLSLIISEIYNKYLPLAEKDGIILDLDFSDTTKEISDPDRIKQFLDEHLSSALKRSDKGTGGEVTIGVTKEAITITDSATTLSHAACALLSNRYIDVSSRVGFGTTVKIFFKPQEPTTPAVSTPPEIKVNHVAAGIAVDNSTNNTVVESKVEVAAKSDARDLSVGADLKLTGADKSAAKSTSPKPSSAKKSAKKPSQSRRLQPVVKLQAAKTKRQLTSAAKKADREVKRIAKKAAREAKKLDKAAKKAAKSVQKSTAKLAQQTSKSSATKTTQTPKASKTSKTTKVNKAAKPIKKTKKKLELS